ncbi:MAG TPA: hypothetical protein PLX06_12200 [Fimbriimonadaceae bacterium]|nr:hypothetical protein [Fimbriimonadaceae bacterium]
MAGLVLLFVGTAVAFGQQGYNARAVEDIKAFLSKSEEGDALFQQKKFAEAADALAAGHESFLRAQRREPEIGRYDIVLKPGQFPALRYYGYGFGSIASLSETPAGEIKGSAAGLNRATGQMWQDAAILSGAEQVPNTFFSDAPLSEMTEERLNSYMSELYGPVSTFKLPVPDDEWRNVVLWSRRALLMMEYALQKYPEWKSGTRSWSRNNNKLQHTGDEALADVKALLAEAEPEYAKVVADAKSAAPKWATDWIALKAEDLDKAIAGVKQNGWLAWNMARDIFIDKDYLSDMRKAVAKIYSDEGKTMPADALKELEDRVATLKSTMQSGAAKWKFPAGKPKNAAIEARATASVKARFSGATILKSALDSGQWIITKNDLDIPRYRSMGVLVLAKIPGQSSPWLIFGYLRQTYSGGGTYAAGGTFQEPNEIRMQAGG